MLTRTTPQDGDVVVRIDRRNEMFIYLLRVAPGYGPLSPSDDRSRLPTREEAVAHGLMLAERRHVRAWVTDGDDDFSLLEDFQSGAVA